MPHRDPSRPHRPGDQYPAEMRTGDVIDDFEAVDQHGERVTLSALVADGPIVLFFYPKAMTPG